MTPDIQHFLHPEQGLVIFFNENGNATHLIPDENSLTHLPPVPMDHRLSDTSKLPNSPYYDHLSPDIITSSSESDWDTPPFPFYPYINPPSDE